MDGLHGIKGDLLPQRAEDGRQIEDPAGSEFLAADLGRGEIEPRIQVEDDGFPAGQLLLHHLAHLPVQLQGPLGHARLVVHEEEDLEADVAEAAACRGAQRVEEIAGALEVERVAEEEGVVRVQEVLGLVVDLAIDGQQLARPTVLAPLPGGIHAQGTVSTARGEAGAAVVEHDQGTVQIVIRGIEDVFVDLETQFGREPEETGGFAAVVAVAVV